MEMAEKKIAIIGYGGMGEQHAKLIRESGVFKISGTYDIKPERNQGAMAAGLEVYPSIQAILEDPTLDLVLIATPNDSHKPLAIDSLRAGKHVICEKPVALNAAELEDILAVEQETGKTFVVHQNRRWDEDFLSVKKIMDDQLIGDIYRIETRVFGSRGIPGDWRALQKNGGGMVLDWGIHLLDRVMTLVPGKIESVYCTLSKVLHAECDDGFTLHLNYESGVVVVVEVGTNNFITLPKWYVLGTAGTAVIEDWAMNGKLTILTTYEDKDAKPIVAGAGLTKTMAPRTDGSVVDRPLPRIQTDVTDYYRNVDRALDGKEPLLVQNSQVLRVMRVIDAAFKSARIGQVVPFET